MAKKETTIDAAALRAEFLGEDAPNNKEVSAETTRKGIDAAALRAEYLSNSAEESDADPTLGLKIGGMATRAGLHNLGATMRSTYNRESALDGVEATDAASQSVANMVASARKRGYMEAEQKRLKPLYDYLESEGDAGEGIKPIDFTQSTLGKSVEEMMPKRGQYIPRGKALLDIMDKNSGVTDKSEMYNNTDRLRAMYMLNPNMAKDSQHVEWNEHYPAPTTPIMTPSEDGLYHIGENTYTHEDMVNALSGYMPVAQHNRLLKYNEHYRDDYARSLGYKNWDDAWETPLKNLTKELEAINEELASETYDKMVSASAFETAPATEGTAFGTYIADMMRGGLTAQQELEKAKALTADDFISGFDEGFNTVEVMSLGYAGIGASANLYNILEKVNNGQALSEREEKVYRAYEIGQELEQLHNEFRGGKRSRANRWGKGVGTSTEAMAQFAASMAATGGIGSGIAAANTGIKQAFKQGLKSGLKQTVKMGGKKAGVYGARSAAAAGFSPMTYSTFADRRVGQYHIDESGNLVKETRPWAKDLGIAYVETFNEYFSEYFGNGMGKLIDVSPSKIGRVFGLDKWAGKKGYGNIGDYLDATFVPTKRMREAMHHVDFAGFVWEAPSEAFGDFMNSLMLAPFSEEHGFEQFATKEYWEDLYGTTAIFGGSLSVLGAPATITNMYNTSKNVKRREAALEKIQDVELRNNLKSVMSLDSMEEMSQAMVDLHIERLSPDQAAAAVEYLTSATMVKVLTGADMEDTRLLELDGYVKNANNVVYKGKDGSLPSDEIIKVVDKSGRELYVEAGDVNNTSDVSMLKCKAYDAENRKWVDVAVPASEVMGMKRESVEQVISAEYERMFGTEILAERLKEIEGARKSMENPSAEVVRGHYLRNGLKVYDTGAEVSLADGRTAVVESMLADGSYLVRSVNPTTQTEELYEVPFMQVLQPEASLAEAQKQMFAKNIESATQSIQRAEATEQSADAGMAEDEDVDADMEDVVEQAQEMPKPVPTREDGSVDFSAIEDPKMFATEYTKKMGAEDKAKTSVAKMAANARAEASQLREKSDKMTDPNEVVDAVAKADAMDARADFYDKVLAEYAPQEEVQSEAYKAGDVVEHDGRIAEVVGEENEGVVIADAQGRMTVVDPTTLSRVAEAPAEENAVDPVEDADDKLVEATEAGIVQNVFGKMLDVRTANVIDAMAKALGVKVAFVENVTTQAGTRANADIKGNVVRIAWAQRRKAISFLAGHEFTHRMKDMSPEAYAEFTKSVKEYLGEAEWQRRMNAQRATYESHNRRAKAEGKPLLSYEDALLEEEVVADFVGDMVENRHAFEHYVQKQSQKPSLLQTIKKVFSAIGRFFRRMGARTEAQRMKEMIAHLDTFINKAREDAKKKGVQGSGKTRRSLIGEQNNVRFSLSSTPIFFSNAQYAVQNIKQEKATPEQWLKMIEKNGGLKAGEDKWLGLSDWLKASDKKTLTKDEVLQYIAENDIQIEEVSYGEPEYVSENEIYESDAFLNLVASLTDYDEDGNPHINQEQYKELQNADPDFLDGFSLDYWGEGLDIDDKMAAARYLGLLGVDNEINGTRLQYTTQGLTKKKEIALVVPTIEPYNQSDEIHFGDAGEGRAVAWIRFGDAEAQRSEEVIRRVDELETPYKDVNGHEIYRPKDRLYAKDFISYGKLKSGEYAYVVYVNDKQIPVAHKSLEDARNALNEHYRANPEKRTRWDKVLVIDEIQSKRHQDGREKGYKTAADEELKNAHGAEIWAMMQKYNVSRPVDLQSVVSAEDAARLDELNQYKFGEVPSAPFEKNWAELAMKRMLRYAAENGYDYVAWTTGDQQADRYDIGSVVKDIVTYDTKDADGNPIKKMKFRMNNMGTYNIATNMEGVIVKGDGEMKEGMRLSDITGKALAEKIMNGEGEDAMVFENGKDIEAKSLEGEELHIGNEGMKAFYDQMLPSFVKKYTKKWGAEVGEVTMPDLEENNTMHAVNVTDSMRESVMQGQPKFSLSEETTQIFDAAKVKFGTTNDIREAGYILPDGSMLDFSGRHQVEGDASFLNGDRTVDHREIADIAYDAEDNETGIKTDLGDFLDRGAIRIDSNAGAINLNVAPTKAQKDRLKRLIERNDGYVYIDFGKGWDTEHYAEYEAARASRVLGDIDRYFDEGIKPAGNVRFSLTEEQATAVIEAMKVNAEVAPQLELTPENWVAEFGKAGKVTTPIGEVKMSEGQYQKMQQQGRKTKLGMVKPTLTNPDVIIEEDSKPKDGKVAERNSSFVFVKAFTNAEGTRDYMFTSVSNRRDGIEIVMSNQEKETPRVKRLLKEGKLAYINKATLPSELTDSAQGDQLTIPSEVSYSKSKDTTLNAEIQTNEQKFSLITPEMDASYLDAVNRGDMETAQRMVLEAAKLAMPNTKVVDENGNPKVVYHGDRKKARYIFSTDTFFTPKEEYAKRYTNGTGEVYATFLDIKRPFDIRDKKAYDIFTEFRGGRKPVVTTTGAMDWGEYSYEDLQEYVEGVAPNEYDGFILDEGADPDGNGGVIHRGLSFVPFAPNQIKSADPVTYDDAGNVIPLSERFNPRKEDVRYSLQSVEPFATYAKNMARALNIAQPIIVADTTEEFVRLMRDAGSKNPERARVARGVYRPSDDAIFINAEKFEKREDMFESILHEWTHAYTQRNISKLEAILATLDEERVKAAGAELLPDFYKNESPLTILNEIISNFVGSTPKPLLLAIMRGQMDIAVFVSEAMSVIKGNEYADIFEAVMPVVKENITNQKERYNGKREEPIVIARWMVADTAQENERPQQYPYRGRQRGGDEQAQYHTGNDRRGEGADAQEVGYRHSIEEIIDTPSDEEYKQQMLELAQQMERDAEERNLDKAQEIADVTGWVHLDDGTWQYYGNVDITEDAKESTRVRRWLESKAAVKKARTRKMYDDLLKEQKKVVKELESESKARRSNASYAKAVDAILQGQAHEALPIEGQILVDVALGQKLRWEDEQGGSRRGLKTELGLRSTTAEGMAEVTGGNTYIEDYIAAVVERNNGYENGIDDNDVRNAVIEVFGSYPSRKAALAELSRRYPDTVLNEATEAIAQLEQERDDALAQIDADLRSELADAEANPSQYERAYEEEGTWNLQFDIYTGALRKARNEVSRMERDMQKAKLTQREKTAAMRTVKRAVVDMLKGDLGRYTRKRDIQALMDAVNEAQTLYAMQRAIDKAMLAINELRLRKETARMNNLLKMRISSHDSAIDPRIFFENMMKGSKNVDSAVRRLMNDYWRGVNSSGVDVTKGVDGDTAKVLQFIRERADVHAMFGNNPNMEDVTKVCDAMRRELRGEAVEKSVFKEDEKKALMALTPEVRERMAEAVSVLEGYYGVQLALDGINDTVTYAEQNIAVEKEAIKELKKQIKALEGQKVAVTDSRIVDAKKSIEEKKKKVEQLHRDVANARIKNASAYIGDMPDILDAFSHLNAQVESLLMGGRVNLSTFNAKQEEHKRNLISMVLESIDNPEAQDWIDPKDHYKLMQKVRGNALVHFTTQHLGSLDHMLRRIDRNAPNGEGRVYNYFMRKITTAKNNIFTHTSEAAEQLNDMANVLFGNSFKQIMRKAESKTLGRITLTRKKENGDTITEKKDVTIATTLNILATWGQEMGKATLIEMGATEDTINQIREWLNNANPAWLQYADWVIKDFLPSRRTRYNEVFREMNGTDMPFEVNYFPIRRLDSAIHRNVDLSDPSFENKPSTVTGAIMTRTKNTVPVDLEVSFFSSLQDNIVEMEEWSAMAPIIRDFNTILSSSAVKKALNAIDAHFAKDVQDAAKVATMNYTGDTAKHDDIFWQMVLRTWASRLLGFKAFTALKQLASSVLFIPYAADREFIGRLVWYYIGGKDRLSNELYKRIGDGKLVAREVGEPSLNIKWALENSPMFRRRWESGVAGYNVFERELKFDNRKAWGRFLRLINEGIGKFTQLSMAPIALVDAYTVAAGMRAIYDFEMKKLLKEGYAKEEAKKIAMFRAEVFANKSQQSSEGEYLSPLQMERGWKSAFTIFQNAPMAQGRNIAEAYNELRRDGDKERAYIKKQETARLRKARAAEYEAIEATIAMEKEQGIITAEEQENLRREKLQKPINEDIERIATNKAVKTVRKAKTKAVLSLLFNAWLGQAVFNAMGIAPYLLFGDDDEEKAKLKKAWFYASIFAPLGTVVLGAQIMSLLQGHNVVFSGALKEFEDGINEVFRYWRDNKYVDAVISAAKFIESKLFGLDPTTYQRAVAGIENMFESGMSAENIMLALNAPQSQVRLLAGDRKEGETAQEYATRIMRLYTILGDPEYSDYYDVKTGKLITDAPAGSMTITQMRRLRKQYEMAYRSDVMRNKGLSGEWSELQDTEEEYEEVVEALGFKANRTPADEAGYIDGEYRAPIEGLSEDDFYNLKYLARYAAEVAKDARTYLGGDEETYLEYVRDEMEAKRELISEYNKILNK